MKLAEQNRELVRKYLDGTIAALEQLCLMNRNFIASCAKEICRKFNCAHLHEDLISIGMVSLLEQIDRYDQDSPAELTTFLHPHLMGAMRREVEEQLGCMKLSKREFHLIRKAKALHTSGYSIPEIAEELKVSEVRASKLLSGSLFYTSLDFTKKGDEEPAVCLIPDKALPVNTLVYLKICIEYVEEEFLRLSFKERELLGGSYDVFGHEEQSLTDLGEQFQLRTTNAVIKARDRALKKLAKNCMEGKLGVWKDVYHAVMDCAMHS